MTDKFGVEYSEDGKTLIKCPKELAGEYVIPEGVTEIGEHAFFACRSLTSVVIPDSVVEIGNCALEECENLTSIDSAIELEDRVFEDCGYIPGEEF